MRRLFRASMAVTIWAAVTGGFILQRIVVDRLGSRRPVSPVVFEGTVFDLENVGLTPNLGTAPKHANRIVIVSSDDCEFCISQSAGWGTLLQEAIALADRPISIQLVGLGGIQLLRRPYEELEGEGLDVSVTDVGSESRFRVLYGLGIRSTPLFVVTEEGALVRWVSSSPTATQLGRVLSERSSRGTTIPQ